MVARMEAIPAHIPVQPGDWIETWRPPRQVAEVARYRVTFTDGTELRRTW